MWDSDERQPKAKTTHTGKIIISKKCSTTNVKEKTDDIARSWCCRWMWSQGQVLDRAPRADRWTEGDSYQRPGRVVSVVPDHHATIRQDRAGSIARSRPNQDQDLVRLDLTLEGNSVYFLIEFFFTLIIPIMPSSNNKQKKNPKSLNCDFIICVFSFPSLCSHIFKEKKCTALLFHG